MLKETKEFLSKGIHFITQDVWELDIYSIGGIKRQLVHVIRVCSLVVRGFRKNKLSIQACSLTYITLVSLVPFMAFIFSILKGIGEKAAFTNKVNEFISPLPEDLQEKIITNIVVPITSVDPKTLGILGSGFFLYTIIKLLGSIEASFNSIWGVVEHRSIFRKFTDYLSTVVAVPILFISGSAIVTVIKKKLAALNVNTDAVTKLADGLGPLGSLLDVASWLLVSISLGLLFRFMPNTKVKMGPALLAGGIIGFVMRVWQIFGLNIFINTAQGNTVYGAFIFVPLMLIVLNISWILVLLGSELSFAIQNSSTYVMEQKAVNASFKSRIQLALAVVLRAADSMIHKLPPLNLNEYAKKNHVPIRLLNDMSHVLKEAGILAEVSEGEGIFVLARTPEDLMIDEIVDIVVNHGSQARELGLRRLDAELDDVLESIGKGVNDQLSSLSVKEMVLR